ncbi:hypothetical protein [Ancylobacter sp. FA202]|uniref:alginate O-acetyltransferase AlgX-related protein n=1 Tax=Ancylobacter sp. FA202 TaxID=1111106 RepID=UPI00037B0C98|nr:hypothetical protein [Ancylobacter sp. FA202]
MALLMAFRRWWAILFVAILSLPTLSLLLPEMPGPIRNVLAPEARWWEHASERLDPYINNSFGFRGPVLAAHRRYLRFIGSAPGTRVLYGTDGSLFLRDDNAMEQSIGQLVRPQAVERLAILARELKEKMTAIGGTFVLTLAPNAHTARFEMLPDYIRQQRQARSEYDLVAARMKRDGITFVDLRPFLAEAATQGPIYYRYDTHWNARAALAAFNAVMAAAGQPQLAIPESEAFGATQIRTSGDLLTVAGITSREPPDSEYVWKPPLAGPHDTTPLTGIVTAPPPEKDDYGFDAFATGHAGPRIMVVGDSFTQSYWHNPLVYRASAAVWIHHAACEFDRGIIDRFKPDILIYAPTERFLTCKNWSRTPLPAGG